MYKKLIPALFALLSLAGCAQKTFTSEEKKLIMDSPDLMKVLTIKNQQDSLSLRTPSTEVTVADMNSEEYKELCRKMVYTCYEPVYDCAGMVAAQVGVPKRIAMIKRFDKAAAPWEDYCNLRIVETRGIKRESIETCASIPGKMDTLMRWKDITVAYLDPDCKRGEPREVTEDVTGYAAVLFQQQIDLMDGILFTDRLGEE